MSPRDKEARVVFYPAQVTVEDLIAVINRLGFHATLKGAGPR